MQHHIIYRNDDSFCGPIVMPAALPGGELLVTFREAKWRGRSMHADPTTRMTVLRSSDRGQTWYSPVSAHPAAGNGASIACLGDGTVVASVFEWIFARPEEAALLEGLPARRQVDPLNLQAALGGTYIVRSDTQGYTWRLPKRVNVTTGPHHSTAGRVIEAPDGAWLLPMSGHVTPDGLQDAWVIRSEDHGESWTGPFVFATGATQGYGFVESRIVTLRSGRILAMARVRQGGYFQSFSEDGGRTWSPAEETEIPCDNSSPADLLQLRDGRVLCTFGRRTQPFGVRARISGDGGQSWPEKSEIILRDDGPDTDMGYPGSVQLDDDTILTCYYWHEPRQTRYIAATTWKLPKATTGSNA